MDSLAFSGVFCVTRTIRSHTASSNIASIKTRTNTFLSMIYTIINVYRWRRASKEHTYKINKHLLYIHTRHTFIKTMTRFASYIKLGLLALALALSHYNTLTPFTLSGTWMPTRCTIDSIYTCTFSQPWFHTNWNVNYPKCSLTPWPKGHLPTATRCINSVVKLVNDVLN